MQPPGGDARAQVDEHRQGLGQDLVVRRLAGVEVEARGALRTGNAEVEGRQGPQQVAANGGGILAGIGRHQLVEAAFMDLAQAVGPGAAVGAGGQSATEDGLGLGALAPVEHGLVVAALGLGRLQVLDGHALGDDAGGAVAEAGDGGEQGGLLLRRGAAGVGPQARGDAEDLQQLRQVAQGVILEQVGPYQAAVQAQAGQVPTFCLVTMAEPT